MIERYHDQRNLNSIFAFYILGKGHRTSTVYFVRLTLLALENAEIMSSARPISFQVLKLTCNYI
jgi:hypothetical protein